jgi:WD40 repeat protein
MHTLKSSAESKLSLPPESYIYSIAPCGPAQATSSRQLAAISSDNALRVLDAQSLQLVHVISSQTHDNGGVTCLNNLRETYSNAPQAVYENLVATAGRDGTVRLWDVRSEGKPVIEMKNRKSVPFFHALARPSVNHS